MYTGRACQQDSTCRVAGGRRHGLACRQWIHQHGPRPQRPGASEEDPRGISQGVPGGSGTRRQAGVLLGRLPAFSLVPRDVSYPSQHPSFPVFCSTDLLFNIRAVN